MFRSNCSLLNRKEKAIISVLFCPHNFHLRVSCKHRESRREDREWKQTPKVSSKQGFPGQFETHGKSNREQIKKILDASKNVLNLLFCFLTELTSVTGSSLNKRRMKEQERLDCHSSLYHAQYEFQMKIPVGSAIHFYPRYFSGFDKRGIIHSQNTFIIR